MRIPYYYHLTPTAEHNYTLPAPSVSCYSQQVSAETNPHLASQSSAFSLNLAQSAAPQTLNHAGHVGSLTVNAIAPSRPVSQVQQQGEGEFVGCQLEVSYVRLPFYDDIAQLLPPYILAERPKCRLHIQCFNFTLTPEQVTAISYPQTTALPRMQVQLRLCPFDFSGPQGDEFPSNCVVRLNDRLVALPALVPTNKPGEEPKRLSQPVDITPYCARNPLQLQRLSITWTSPPAHSAHKAYMVQVMLVRRVDSKVLCARLKNKGFQTAEVTKRMIRAKVSNNDSDILASNLRISLLCPLTKMRMGIPAKVKTCDHVQCFDANSFLKMNEKKPTWTCPVCDTPAPYDNLIIDGYLNDVLSKTDSAVVEVDVHADGSWVTLNRTVDNKSSALSSTSNNSRAKADARTVEPLIILDASVEDDCVLLDDDDDANAFYKKNRERSSKGNASKPVHVDVIELSSSEDENEEELKATRERDAVEIESDMVAYLPTPPSQPVSTDASICTANATDSSALPVKLPTSPLSTDLSAVTIVINEQSVSPFVALTNDVELCGDSLSDDNDFGDEAMTSSATTHHLLPPKKCRLWGNLLSSKRDGEPGKCEQSPPVLNTMDFQHALEMLRDTWPRREKCYPVGGQNLLEEFAESMQPVAVVANL